MSRVSRKDLKSNYFHVIVQGIEKSYIFEKYNSKEKYLRILAEKIEKRKVKILSYCIMDNHVHMLVYTENIKELSEFMRCTNTTYGMYYNKMNERVGYVFKERYKCIPIGKLPQLYRTMIYIHMNPVNAGICTRPELYLYSSYNDYILKKGLLYSEESTRLMFFNQENYIELFKFMHYLKLDDNKINEENVKNTIIQKYVDDNNIKDYIFEPEKIRKMIKDLKKRKIGLLSIAKFFDISVKRLKDIISE